MVGQLGTFQLPSQLFYLEELLKDFQTALIPYVVVQRFTR